MLVYILKISFHGHSGSSSIGLLGPRELPPLWLGYPRLNPMQVVKNEPPDPLDVKIFPWMDAVFEHFLIIGGDIWGQGVGRIFHLLVAVNVKGVEVDFVMGIELPTLDQGL